MSFIRTIKRYLYFKVAAYFGFWAKRYLKRWNPTVIAAVGSSGKTTLLHLIESQMGGKAIVSHKANSAFGIPFNILGLERKSFSFFEWPLFAIRAPFQSLRALPEKNIYVAESDAERPGEGKFLAELLTPDIVVWLSLEEAHGVNFDRLADIAASDVRDAVKKEMAREFGYFLDHAKTAVILNKDNSFIIEESRRAQAPIEWISGKDMKAFKVHPRSVEVALPKSSYVVPALIPPEAATSVLAAVKVAQSLGFTIDATFKDFVLPPGRSSLLKGKNGVTIIDSTYNATIGGMQAMLKLLRGYPARGEIWCVLGDMIEQGRSEKKEHEALADMIREANPARVILVGPRLRATTHGILLPVYGNERIVSFLMPGEALAYLEKELKGGETILFKGARFLEGVVEKLLEDHADAALLCRREKIWEKRRNEWGV
jgi:UDP-N-acetylmuramoyl-tripeptide--D-alanyl-D-alanine ligase